MIGPVCRATLTTPREISPLDTACKLSLLQARVWKADQRLIFFTVRGSQNARSQLGALLSEFYVCPQVESFPQLYE